MFVYRNYYVRDILRRVKKYSHNKKINKIVKECEKIDSILDYSMFKQYISNVKAQSNSIFLAKEMFGGEGLLYGHREAFFDYAGITHHKERFLFPHFEHGIDLKGKILPAIYDELNHSFVYQGPYKNEMTHRERPMCPVYNLGPYVLYAKKYYDVNRFAKIKEKNGKTVLLFPAHTFEGATVTFDKEKFVKDVFDQFREDYDTILVSVYWNDVDDPIYDLFEKEGAQLVSAGFRGDSNFIVRLRAMIEMSDAVASNALGSYIGYAMALDKPFYMFKDKAKLYDPEKILTVDEEKAYLEVVDKIFWAFSSLYPNKEQRLLQKEIFYRYWGGIESFKSKEEARDIIKLSEKLLKYSHGTTDGYEQTIKKAMNKQLNLKETEYQILKKALE